MQPWEIPVLMTTAHSGEGVRELLETLDAHLGHLQTTGELGRRRGRRRLDRVRAVVNRGLRLRIWRDGKGDALLEAARSDLESGRRSPYEVADEILRSVMPDP
jgi:LAO/AO transport system kinase